MDYNKLLGRDPLSTDLNSIQDYIKGKRVLVTGGAGSIGSEIVRQLVNFGASTVTVFDNAEASMFHLEQEVSRTFPKAHIKYVIGDVRDKYRLEEVFDSFKPNIVFHAAAYKHVPIVEYNLIEGLKNNVLGTFELAKLITNKYSKNLEKICIINPNWYIYSMTTIVWPFLSKKVILFFFTIRDKQVWIACGQLLTRCVLEKSKVSLKPIGMHIDGLQ